VNLQTDRWDKILADALRIPGEHDPTPMIWDGPFHWSEWATSEWSAEQAFHRLGLRLMDWPDHMPRTEASGVCRGDGIALNPMARNKIRTAAHELAHAIFQHGRVRQVGFAPIDAFLMMAAEARTPINEFEADCTALLVCFALGQDERELSVCRAYVQDYTKAALPMGLPTTWEPIKRTAQQILAAGASNGHAFGVRVRPKPRPVKVNDVRDFVTRLKRSGR
jgi:hypothetical protein